VDELGAELDRDREAGKATRPAAAADPAARLQDDDRTAGFLKSRGGGQAGGAGAQDEDVWRGSTPA
jgi:hypothetical protein